MTTPKRFGDGDLSQTLAHHDAAIDSLGSRMTGVESGLKSLTDDVQDGFARLGSKLDRLDSRPAFDLHKSISTVLSLAVLFSMVVAGIIWVTTSQFGAVVAEQKAHNAHTNAKLGEHDTRIEKLTERLSWAPRVETARSPGALR